MRRANLWGDVTGGLSDAFIGAYPAPEANPAGGRIDRSARRIGFPRCVLAEDVRDEPHRRAERGGIVRRRIKHGAGAARLVLAPVARPSTPG
jgi:hypothetical protein